MEELDRDADAWIAQERKVPAASLRFWILLAGLGLIVIALSAGLGSEPERSDAEDLYREGDGLLQAIQSLSNPEHARYWNAAAAGIAVAAVGIAAWRFLHSEWAALFAASLVALDSAFLAHAQLATPVVPVLAATTVALAGFLASSKWHWVAAIALSAGAFLDPRVLLWSAPIALLLLVRGHIYAAPQHGLNAGIQAIGLPVAAAAMGIVAGDNLGPRCYQSSRFDALFQRTMVDLDGTLAIHNPVLWFGGIFVVALLGLGALWYVASSFRLQRLPGRIQVRLPEALRRNQGRAIWLLMFAIFAPTPMLLLPILAIGFALGAMELGRDAKGFGITVALVALGFVLAFTIRLLPLIMHGEGSELIPWATVSVCS